MKTPKNIISYLITILSAIAVFVVVAMLCYFIACYFAPSVFIENKTGQVHGLMPIGQSIIAITSGTIASIITLLLLVKYFRKQRRKD